MAKVKQPAEQQAFWDPGLEYLDPTPVAVPVGYGRPESLQQTIQRLVRNELSQAAASAGMDTFEESLDFDVGDEDSEHETMYERAADMQEELREQRYAELSNAELQRAADELGVNRADNAGVGGGARGTQGGGSGVDVPVNRRAETGSGSVRASGGAGKESDPENSAAGS